MALSANITSRIAWSTSSLYGSGRYVSLFFRLFSLLLSSVTNVNIFQIDSVVCYDVAYADLYKSFFIFLIRAIQSQVSKSMHEVYRVLPMLLANVVKVTHSDIFLILKVLLREPTRQVLLRANKAWCQCCVPYISTIHETFWKFRETEIMIIGIWSQRVN